MYVGMVTFPVLPGKLDEAIELWKTVSVPEAESQPGFIRAMLWRDDARNTLVGIGIWRSKADSDAFAATGPWRPGSHQHQRFAALCGADPERQEFAMVVDIEP